MLPSALLWTSTASPWVFGLCHSTELNQTTSPFGRSPLVTMLDLVIRHSTYDNEHPDIPLDLALLDDTTVNLRECYFSPLINCQRLTCFWQVGDITFQNGNTKGPLLQIRCRFDIIFRLFIVLYLIFDPQWKLYYLYVFLPTFYTIWCTRATVNGHGHRLDGGGPFYWDGKGGNGGKTKPSPMVKYSSSTIFFALTTNSLVNFPESECLAYSVTSWSSIHPPRPLACLTSHHWWFRV